MCIKLRKVEEKSDNDVFAPEKQQNPEYNKVWKVEFVKDSKTIGGASIVRTKKYPFFIDFLWVDAQYRGQGYGRLAYSLVEKWAKEMGSEEITLLSTSVMMGFWKKMGFQTADLHRGGDLKYLTADGYGNMIKNIDEQEPTNQCVGE